MERSFEILVSEHRPMMIAYAKTVLGQHGAMSAEDVVQDACVAAYKNLEHFDSAKGSFGTWLRVIIRNRAIDKLRQNKSKTFLEIDDYAQGLEDVFVVFDKPSVDREWGERVDILWECVGELKKPMQAIVKLFYLTGHSLKEIAGIHSINKATATQRLKRARDIIRKCAKRKQEASA